VSASPKEKTTIEKLNEVIVRLTEENAQIRKQIDEVKVIIRRRSPNADGLSTAGSIKVILADRDQARDKIVVFRDELKKALRLLAEGKVKEVYHEINQFLFNNQI